MPSGFIMHDVTNTLAAALEILESAREEVVWLIPASVNALSMTQGFVEKVQVFIQKGGVSRGIVDMSSTNIREIQAFLDVGEDIRHSDVTCEVFMYVADKRRSISSINIGVTEFTFDTPVVAFQSDDPTYAAYLLTSFENAWSQAIPAEERLQELLKQQAG